MTEEDVGPAASWPSTVTRYAAELEKFAAKTTAAATGESDRAGGVMANLMEAGRLELVPPAAPGFSPACTKEVTRLCARS